MKNIYEIIKKPCLTEKAMGMQESENKIVLRVDPRANKIEIKQACEKLFNVKVENVRTANVHGKRKRLGLHSGRTNDWKKAFVTLAEGEKLDFLEEL